MSLLLFAIVFALAVTSLEVHQPLPEVGEDDEMHYFIAARQQLPHIRLVRDLLATERYDPSVRPVVNHSQSLTVHISMSLYQLVDVDEPSQYLILNIWMIQKWVDEFLDWNPSEYNMINSTVLPHDVLWIPDTIVYNSMMMSREGSERYMNAVVKSKHWSGKRGAEVLFLYPALYTVRCRIDVYYFPYDHQNCTLTLGSWTSHKALVNYTADEVVNMYSYIPNEEWDVLSFNLHRREHLYSSCQTPWVIIEGFLIIRRKPLHYIVNYIIPTIVLTLVAVVGFFTPASTNNERREKITIGITALLAISILMLMVSDQMPTISDFVPLIAWFYLSNIIIISTATFSTCTVLRIHGNHRHGKLPPSFVRILFFKYICNYLCVSPPHELVTLWSGGSKSTSTETSMEPSVPAVVNDRGDAGTQQRASTVAAKKKWTQISLTFEGRSAVTRKESSLTSVLQKIRKTSKDRRKDSSFWNTVVQFIGSAESKTLKHHRQCTLEWEFLALVVDRVFLLFFSIITILIVTALAVTAKLAQYHFDASLKADENPTARRSVLL